MIIRALALAAIAVVISAMPALAHHSFAMFDGKKTKAIEGTVKEFQWTNPAVSAPAFAADIPVPGPAYKAPPRGLAYGDAQSIINHNDPILTGATVAGSQSETRVGWAAGGGVNYAVTRNWMVGVDHFITISDT
jgi:hypothetical protein